MGVCETSVVVGDVSQKVQTMSCEMSEVWGDMCSMLTVVNPILLLHMGNLSGEYIVSVFTHRTWDFGGDGCVDSWIVINTAWCTHVSHGHMVYGICTYTRLVSRFSPIRHAPWVLMWGLAPGMCTGCRCFQSGPCIEHQGS